MQRPLDALLAREEVLLARRERAPDVAASVAEAFAACGVTDHAVLEAGRRIAAAVERHGAGFAPGEEPAYHDRHHQAEAVLATGWMARAVPAESAACCVLAMAGHDLLHDGTLQPGLEARSASATLALCATLPEAMRREIRRLILLTDPTAPAPTDLAGRLVREADLFGSLTPRLGPRLSAALAREWTRAGHPDAAALLSFSARAALLTRPAGFSEAACETGLAAGVRAQQDALARAGEAQSAEAGAALLDRLPREAAEARHREALAACGLPAGFGA
jgi:hypothetical protein